MSYRNFGMRSRATPPLLTETGCDDRVENPIHDVVWQRALIRGTRNQLGVFARDLSYLSRRISLDFFCYPCVRPVGVRRDNIDEHPNNQLDVAGCPRPLGR